VSIQKFRSSPQTQCSNTTEGSKSDIDIKNLLFEENMLVKAVDDKNMIVKEFGKVLLLEMQLHFCVCRLQKKMCPYLLQDCERICVDEDLNLTKEKNLQFTNVVGFLTQLRWMMM